MSHLVALAGLTAVIGATIHAQSLVGDGSIPAKSLGLPVDPPFLTLLGMVNAGKLATDPEILPIGAVSEIFHEELRTQTSPGGAAGEVLASVRMKFDEDGRVTQRIERRYGVDRIDYRYQDAWLVSAEAATLGRVEQRTARNWTYDDQGRLSEYRTTVGAEIFNHELNFSYDEPGRRLSSEFRQGADDKPFSRTDFHYSDDGMTVVITKAYVGTNLVDRSTQTLDDHGRVVRVVRDSERRQLDPLARDIRFRFDDKSRLVGQVTEAIKFSDAGAEHDLPPGTISIAYHDGARIRTTRYASLDGDALELAVTSDERGATIAYTLTHTPPKDPPRLTIVKLECESDRFSNWTSCAEIREQDGDVTVAKRFRRTLSYRH